MAHREDIGKNIILDLSARAMTQQSLAVAIGAHASMVNRWIRGGAVPRRQYAEKIAAVLGTDAARYTVSKEEA